MEFDLQVLAKLFPAKCYGLVQNHRIQLLGPHQVGTQLGSIYLLISYEPQTGQWLMVGLGLEVFRHQK